jgi:hypothetical protein
MATSALLVQVLAQIQTQTATCGAGIGLGSAVAVVCSWQRNRSIPWARTVKVTR